MLAWILPVKSKQNFFREREEVLEMEPRVSHASVRCMLPTT